MFNTLSDLIGLRIDDERIIDFMEKNGFKYPKKPFISNRSTETSYWVENKKQGVDLLFGTETYLENYPLVQGDRKGVFVPVLYQARWYNNKSKTVFPSGLDFDHDFESLKAKLGEPTMKSSDITPTWLNDDGSESFYRWKIETDAARDINFGLEFTDDQKIADFTLGLKYHRPLIHLYYSRFYETFDTFLKASGFYRMAYLMFLQWGIDRDLIQIKETTLPVARDVKERKVPVTEWVRAMNRGYILEDDFVAEKAFVHAYMHRLSGHDILYTQDVAYAFLESAELRQNYFGKAAEAQLNAIVYNEENYEKVRSIIDMRLAEYKAHKFAQSKQV